MCNVHVLQYKGSFDRLVLPYRLYSMARTLSGGIAYIEQGENHGKHYDSRWD